MVSMNLEKIAELGDYPPVHLWKPEFCGDMDLVIKRNGEWVHEGRPIQREKLVRLFSRVLWQEGEAYFLVTPHEKVRIQVEDAPFIITQCQVIKTEDGLSCFEMTTLTNDRVRLGVDADLELKQDEGDWKPYVTMRYGMLASLHRNVFYDLVNNYLLDDGDESATSWWIESAGKRYCIGRS